MLHWSQEASTGWTRNSWVWSRVKTRRAFHAAGRAGRGTRGGRRRRRPEITKPCAPVHREARSGERAPATGPDAARPAIARGPEPPSGAGRGGLREVDAPEGRSYAGPGLRRRAAAGTGACVTP